MRTYQYKLFVLAYSLLAVLVGSTVLFLITLNSREDTFIAEIKRVAPKPVTNDAALEEALLILSPLTFVSHPETKEYINKIFVTLCSFDADTSSHEFRFVIIDNTKHPGIETGVNPYGMVRIGSDDLIRAKSEAEIAGIIAHEMGHIVLQHTGQRIARQAYINDKLQNGKFSFLDSLAFQNAVTTLMVESEIVPQVEADEFALLRLNAAGYAARDFAVFLESFPDLHRAKIFLKNMHFKKKSGNSFKCKTADDFKKWKISLGKAFEDPK